MRNYNEEQNFIRQYLLGELDEQKQEQIEKRIIAAPDYLEEVLMLEQELMEDYAAGALSEHDREKFLKHSLSTPRQVQKLKLTKALLKYTSVNASANSPPAITGAPGLTGQGRWFPIPPRAGRFVGVFSVSILVLIVLVSSWMLFIMPSIQHAADERELAQLNGQQSGDYESSPNVFLLGTLNPGTVRGGGEVERVEVPGNADVVQVRLDAGRGEYQSYRAILQRVEDTELFEIDNLKPRIIDEHKVVVINMPARILTPDDYQLKLSGINSEGQPEDIGQYNFRVSKR